MKNLGPGLIFAGAAVGVSHLVQSTRAGALFGLSLIAIIIIVNILKYPSFRFGVDYATATGKSLIHGYKQLGTWAVYFVLIAVGIAAPVIITAVSVTTAGIFSALITDIIAVNWLAVILMVTALAVLISGGYHWLERINKVFIFVLTLSTLIATALVLPRIDWSAFTLLPVDMSLATVLFILALAGFMPNPTDMSVSQSIWTIKARRDSGIIETVPDARQAFSVGYSMSAFLAICFLIMGTGVMHTEGIQPSSNAVEFAGQIISLYGNTLGPVAGVLAGISALSVMLTTLLAAFDAYGRSLSAASYTIMTGEDDDGHGYYFKQTLIVLAVAATVVVLTMFGNFSAFIDLATTVAFLTSPLFAILNYMIVAKLAATEDARPTRITVIWHFTGILLMIILGGIYLTS